MGNQNCSKEWYALWLAGWRVGGGDAGGPGEARCLCLLCRPWANWVFCLKSLLPVRHGTEISWRRDLLGSPSSQSSCDRDCSEGAQTTSLALGAQLVTTTQGSVRVLFRLSAPLWPGPEHLPQTWGWQLHERHSVPQGRMLRNGGPIAGRGDCRGLTALSPFSPGSQRVSVGDPSSLLTPSYAPWGWESPAPGFAWHLCPHGPSSACCVTPLPWAQIQWAPWFYIVMKIVTRGDSWWHLGSCVTAAQML